MRRIILSFFLWTMVYGLWTGEAGAWQWPWQKRSPQSTVDSQQQKWTKALNYEELVRRNLQLRQRLKALEENYKSLENERNTLVLHIKELQKEKDNLTRTVRGLQELPAEFPKIKLRLDKVNKRLGAVTRDRDRLQKELDKVRGRLADLNKTILDEVQKRIGKIRTERTAVFKTLQDEKVTLQNELRNTKIAFDKEKRRLEKRIKELESQVNLPSAKCQLLEKEIEKLHTIHSTLSEENKRLVRDLEDARRKNQRLEKELQDKEKNLQQLATSHQQRADEIERLKANNQKLQAELKSARYSQKIAEREKALVEKEKEEIKRKTDKERLDIHYNLAVVFDKNGMYKEAENEYLKCLKIDPQDAGVHYNLGILYDDKLNNNRLAIKHYKKFLQLRPIGEDAEQVRQWIFNAEQEKRIGVELR